MSVLKTSRGLKALILVAFAVISIAGTIDLNNLFNYENQAIPSYINRDNTAGNPITDEGATLGRVLFYDKKLSVDNTIACASCHHQEFAFSDTARASVGVDGTTPRHSMRLINARFTNEAKFFWDERASSLEAQTTMPIQDHIEMGWSGMNGDPDLDSLMRKMAGIDYYKQLFTLVYGDTIVTETRIQNAIAQFVRSIQSFDSKYDVGRAQVNGNGQPFPNFTAQENNGKHLFMMPPQFDANGSRIGGGLGCQGCHRSPVFDIDPNSGNNGFVATINNTGFDFTITRSPTLRDLFDTNGVANGPFMHHGVSTNIQSVLSHYDSIVVQTGNTNIDPRLVPGGNPQRLNLTVQERADVIAFLHTLTGRDVYRNEKWSNPFDAQGNLTIVGQVSLSEGLSLDPNVTVYPNPASQWVNVEYESYQDAEVIIYDQLGRTLAKEYMTTSTAEIDVSQFPSGLYVVTIQKVNGTEPIAVTRFIRQ